MRRTTPGLPLLLAGALLSCGPAWANGYNHISQFGIPLLIIGFAVAYTALAPLPALLVWAFFRWALRRRGGFAGAFLGAWLGGEAGIGGCVACGRLLDPAEDWGACLDLPWPWIVGGLALLGAALGCWLARGPAQEKRTK